LENGTITESHLDVNASVPGIDESKFRECVEEAKKNCPISKLLNTNITAEAKLQAMSNA
jgi:osmotically inducible protein OsmC